MAAESKETTMFFLKSWLALVQEFLLKSRFCIQWILIISLFGHQAKLMK
ncbi:hypothetical protein [Marinospirillum insulare]|nr:hypothetical protein [Marinospirillum insulare]